MIKNEEKLIYVFADWSQLKGSRLIGTLYVQRVRGEEIISFEYSESWLKNKYVKYLDPELLLFPGRQYTYDGNANFGIFHDSSPDRWGRLLMSRREFLMAKKEGRPVKKLSESDYLLGVLDLLRQGGLRFKLNPDGDYVNYDNIQAVPPWSSLKNLQYASQQIDSDKTSFSKEYEKWLNLLLSPGSSLGGARPKAGIIDERKELWIAKFPSPSDEKNIGAWEMVLNILASQCEINVPKAQILKISGKHHTYLSKRFDRVGINNRLHYASALTLLGVKEGSNSTDGMGYFDIARFILQYGSDPIKDLEQLWKRILFNVLVSNTDDHLRNHGFILENNGWCLSPAFDMNPNEFGTGLTLNINETSNELNIDLLIEIAKQYKLNNTKVNRIIKKTIKEIGTWKSVAKNVGIARNEIEFMRTAFSLVK